MRKNNKKIYLVLISIHGLIRSHDLELGRDADTGGQTKYVIDLAKALAEHQDVGHVDLITRRIVDKNISEDYAVPTEMLSDNARIVRIDADSDRQTGLIGYGAFDEDSAHLFALEKHIVRPFQGNIRGRRDFFQRLRDRESDRQ